MATLHPDNKTSFTDFSNNNRPLSEHVREAMACYFAQLDGHDASGLYDLVLAEVEKPLLETTLKYANFNQTKTAKLLGLSRSTLRKKLDHYGIS
jgi:Fis family transcriptional regulator, factor for inversion stimulation protein